MFNGIIKNTGFIKKISKIKNNCVLEISTNLRFKKNEIGSSVSCSGACLTVEKINKNLIKFFVSKETLSKTNFQFSKNMDVINLEKSLKFGERVSGHFVQGHVDTTAVIKNIIFIGKSWKISFILSKKYKKYLVRKGSIAINGVSFTISKIFAKGFEVTVIPHTLKLTNLINLKKNDIVNIELDVLGKYINNFIK